MNICPTLLKVLKAMVSSKIIKLLCFLQLSFMRFYHGGLCDIKIHIEVSERRVEITK